MAQSSWNQRIQPSIIREVNFYFWKSLLLALIESFKKSTKNEQK